MFDPIETFFWGNCNFSSTICSLFDIVHIMESYQSTDILLSHINKQKKLLIHSDNETILS